MNWVEVLGPLTEGRDLTAALAHDAMAEILAGEATSAHIAGFAIALRMKGETVDELTGLLRAMVEAADPVHLDPSVDAIDTCGTGGDRSGTINISSIAALVVAGAGVPVCKHGARAASSLCGTADVLEELGVAIELPPEGVLRCVQEVGIGFCLAPRYHPAFRFAAPSRREIGIATVFNLLGPMANPGRVKRQLIGVANPAVAERMLASLRLHGSHRAWVVHGNGLDELTTTGPSTVLALDDDMVRSFTVDPVALGLAPAIADELVGGTPAVNAEFVRRVMGGEHGAHRNIVVLNAAAALVVAGVTESIESGLLLAAESIDSGKAADRLARFAEVSQQAAAELGH